MPTPTQPTPAALHLAAAMIRSFEGCRLTAYWDSYGGCWSIGYGFCTLMDGSRVTARTPALSQSDCEALLEAKLRRDYVPDVLTACAGIALTDGQLAALTSFAYNLGPARITQAGLPALLRAGNVQSAANRMLAYNMAGGVQLAGLVTRRKGEAAVLCGSAWPVPVAGTVPAPHVLTGRPVGMAVLSESDAANAAELARIRAAG